jgi:hypothetical protein
MIFEPYREVGLVVPLLDLYPRQKLLALLVTNDCLPILMFVKVGIHIPHLPH